MVKRGISLEVAGRQSQEYFRFFLGVMILTHKAGRYLSEPKLVNQS